MSLPADRQALIEHLFRAIDGKDTESFLDCLDVNARFRFGSADPVTGSAAIASAVQGFFDSIRALEHSVVRTLASGDTVVCEGVVTYSRSVGGEISLPFCNVFEFADEKIADYKVYVDIAPLYAT